MFNFVSVTGTGATVTSAATGALRQPLLNVPTSTTIDERWTAEVLWAMKVVASHMSYNSCTDNEKLFQRMFPDSVIAKSFTCGEKKCAYVVCYGLAPFFVQQLADKIKLLDCFVLLFDESLNKFTQTQQMDIHVRYFDEALNAVSTRYFTSAFLGHATAVLMVEAFMDKCHSLNMTRMIQLSMDGPNVNWSFYKKLMAEVHETDGKRLVDLGSCGLHVVHNAFKAGFEATTWDLRSFLCALHRIFHESPARREDYTKITGSDVFPLKFCPHRWVENARVANRALLVLGNVTEYVDTITRQPKLYTVPNNKSFDTVKEGCKCPLMPAKLMVFESVAHQFDEFLVRYQTDRPMVPFLCRDLDTLLRGICQRFVKKSVLDEANTAGLLVKLNVSDVNVHVLYAKIDPGFSAARKLKELATRKKHPVSERGRMEFRLECKKMLIRATEKLLEKCPLTYTMTRNLSCMDPTMMAANKDDCVAKFGRVLHKMVDLNQIREQECDVVQREYRAFLDEVVATNNTVFKEFQCDKERLDSFLVTFMKGDTYAKLWAVTKKILILSHGQATVERGFSINSALIVENLKEESVVSQRLVFDAIAAEGGVLSVPITKSLLSYAQAARQKYMTYLDEQKVKRAAVVTDVNAKRKFEADALEKLESKRRRLENDVKALQASADELADSAESSGDLTLLSKSNALRKSAKQKAVELKDTIKKISDVVPQK